MKFVSRAFTPTSNRRLNELVGFLLFVCAVLLLLALRSEERRVGKECRL